VEVGIVVGILVLCKYKLHLIIGRVPLIDCFRIANMGDIDGSIPNTNQIYVVVQYYYHHHHH
jgi:hypothetical protein